MASLKQLHVINLNDSFTFKTGIVVAVVTWHIVPSVTMLCTKSMYTVLISPVVWLPWRPESKITYFLVVPNKRPFYTSVIKTYPGPFPAMLVLDVHIFFLVVNCHQL